MDTAVEDETIPPAVEWRSGRIRRPAAKATEEAGGASVPAGSATGVVALRAPCCCVYDPFGEHAFLSNYASTPFVLRGETWRSAEHFFQAAKFASGEVRGRIKAAATAEAAKAIAWAPENAPFLLPGWDQRRIAVMRRALSLKFDQSAAARSALVASWPQPILEDSPYDPFWGVGSDGRGANALGSLLEEERARFCGFPDLLRLASDRLGPGRGGASETRFAWAYPAPVDAPCERRALAYAPFQNLDIGRELRGQAGTGGDAFDPNRHAQLLDAKYARYRWTDDARSVVRNWSPMLLGLIAARCATSLERTRILSVGAGSANEAANLWRRFGDRATLVDWGAALVENCRAEAPVATVLKRRAENLADVPDGGQDVYCSLRTYDSAFIDIDAGLREAVRTLRSEGLLMISVSDAYLTRDGDLVRGQIGASGLIDRSASWWKLLEIAGIADDVGFNELSFFDLQSEIGLCAVAPTRPG